MKKTIIIFISTFLAILSCFIFGSNFTTTDDASNFSSSEFYTLTDENFDSSKYYRNDPYLVAVDLITTKIDYTWYLFSDCTNLVSVSIIEIDSLGMDAFRNCTSLETVYLPKVTKISNAFDYGCSSLKTVTIPNAQEIEYSFYSCPSLETITLTNAYSIVSSFFYECDNLKSIYINLSYSGILQNTNVNNLPYVVVDPDDVNVDRYFYTLTDEIYVEGKSYSNDVFLKAINLKNVTTIDASQFAECYGLESVILINVEYLPENAFKNCVNLSEISLPNTRSIGANAFNGCISLQDFDLEGVLEIHEGSFANCSSLENVYLPKILSLKKYSFENCTSLEKLQLFNLITIANENSIEGCDNLVAIYVGSVFTDGIQSISGVPIVEHSNDIDYFISVPDNVIISSSIKITISVLSNIVTFNEYNEHLNFVFSNISVTSVITFTITNTIGVSKHYTLDYTTVESTNNFVAYYDYYDNGLATYNLTIKFDVTHKHETSLEAQDELFTIAKQLVTIGNDLHIDYYSYINYGSTTASNFVRFDIYENNDRYSIQFDFQNVNFTQVNTGVEGDYDLDENLSPELDDLVEDVKTKNTTTIQIVCLSLAIPTSLLIAFILWRKK